MMQENEHGIQKSSLLTQIEVSHGYSTRQFGDMRWNKNRQEFLATLGVGYKDLVTGEQVHGIQIVHVDESQKGKVMTGSDGLVSNRSGILLGVTFADCVPILAIDKNAGVIGTAHAGWKGTLGGIARELINHMTQVKAEVNNIYVSIGPHIGMCCYNVMPDRAEAFQKVFGNNELITAHILSEWHLDIGYANYQLLLDAGIKKDHIDAPPTCTSCQVAKYNSFRKDPKEHFGVQLGVIAL